METPIALVVDVGGLLRIDCSGVAKLLGIVASASCAPHHGVNNMPRKELPMARRNTGDG
jgi:hypothetical protein